VVVIVYIPAAQRALVGSMVRQYRHDAGLDLADTAGFLKCDRSKMSRIESGERGFSPAELRGVLTGLGVDAAAQDLLAAISGWRVTPGWWQGFLLVLPDPYLDFVIPETFAAQALIYAPLQIPEPLCIPAYIEALVAGDPSIPKRQEARVVEATQVRRQILLNERRTRLSVVIGEAALRHQVGGADVLRQQLTHLAELTSSDYGWISIRILPFDADASAAGGAGGFSVLQFDEIPSLAVMYLSGPNGGQCLFEPRVTASYVKVFPSLNLHALTPSLSARKIIQMASR
jgi:transcriptional regulator with XRE-family HTH domain